MRLFLTLLGVIVLTATGCNGAAIERIHGDEQPAPDERSVTTTAQRPESPAPSQPADSSASTASDVAINGYALTAADLDWLDEIYGLYVEPGDYWYDPVSGAWGYRGGPTAGFLAPFMELGYAPADASGGGTGVYLNGRELHPYDLASLQQLLGYIYPGAYWLDANGYFGVEGGQALGNLIYVAQGVSGDGGGGYYDSTYFGNIGSDGQNAYFYDSDSGCSVMSDGGVSC